MASVRVWVPLGRAVKLRWPLARTKVPDLEDRQIGVAASGWQQAATDAVHTHVVGTSVRPRLNPTEQANVSPKAIVGVPFQCFLSDVVSRPSSVRQSQRPFGSGPTAGAGKNSVAFSTEDHLGS